jgi:hypothetical protein
VNFQKKKKEGAIAFCGKRCRFQKEKEDARHAGSMYENRGSIITIVVTDH